MKLDIAAFLFLAVSLGALLAITFGVNELLIGVALASLALGAYGMYVWARYR